MQAENKKCHTSTSLLHFQFKVSVPTEHNDQSKVTGVVDLEAQSEGIVFVAIPTISACVGTIGANGTQRPIKGHKCFGLGGPISWNCFCGNPHDLHFCWRFCEASLVAILAFFENIWHNPNFSTEPVTAGHGFTTIGWGVAKFVGGI